MMSEKGRVNMPELRQVEQQLADLKARLFSLQEQAAEAGIESN